MALARLLFLPRQIACFIYDDFQQCSGLQLQSGNSRFFWWQAQLKGEKATTAIWEPEIFGGRPSWKATGLQLQSGNSRFFGGRPS